MSITSIIKIKAQYDNDTNIEDLINHIGEKYIVEKMKFIPKTPYNTAYIVIKAALRNS